MAVFSGLAVLAAKIASASTVAQATAGLGIAVAGVTGAGAAGLLPGPLQNGVAGAVEAVTPFELPHSEGDAAPVHRDTSDSRLDGPGDVPTATDVPTSAPATAQEEQEEQEAEVEHSAEATDATHQHRSGHSETVPSPATLTSAPRTSDDHVETHSTETEGHHGGDDSGGGSGSGSGGSGGDDDSGHGGDDD